MSPSRPDPPPPDAPPAAPIGCRTQHARRLLVAASVFAVSLLATLALVTTFIIRDLSESRVNRILRQARQEAEAVARMASDPGTLSEGETVDEVDARHDDEVDPEAVLAGLLPKVYDEHGKEISLLGSGPVLRRKGGLVADDMPQTSLNAVSGKLESRGHELEYLVNGEVVRRDAFQFIVINYRGGRRVLQFTSSDTKDWDPSVLQDPKTQVSRIQRVYRPTSRSVTMAWESTIDGQPVVLQAGIDSSVLDEGVAELRRRTIPKVLAGGAVFIVLLGMAYVYVFRLLGEARRLEVEASQQALLAQVGMLAAGLAHEIRNPLSAVQMNLQLLEEDLEDCAAATAPHAPASAEPGARASDLPGGPGEHVALLHATQREIRRLGSLVSDFLTYARPTTPRPMPVRIDALVHDCVELFRARAAGDGVELVSDPQAGDDPVLLDEAMVKQALMNVLKNAIEAVPHPGGHVTVSTRRSAGAVIVSVADDGPGVPGAPEEMFRVFHSTKKGGTGLGLPISRALVERQGGSLVASPGARGGAVFTLTLPTVVPAQPEVVA